MRNVHSTFKMKNTHFTDELSFHNHNSSLLRIFLFCDTEVSLSFCLRPHSGDFDQAVEMVWMHFVSGMTNRAGEDMKGKLCAEWQRLGPREPGLLLSLNLEGRRKDAAPPLSHTHWRYTMCLTLGFVNGCEQNSAWFSVQYPCDFSIISESGKQIFLANVEFVLHGVSYCLQTMGTCTMQLRNSKGGCNLMIILLWYIILF